MRAVVIEEPGKAVVKEVALPKVERDGVLIRIESSGICGTDIHIYRGEYLGDYPIIPGHEFSGVVEKVGPEVKRIRVGDRVTVEPNIACDNCSSCLNNRQNFCESWNGVGVTLPGGMAEYAAVPEKAVFSIGDLDFDAGAFVEPLSCVLHGVIKAQVSLADKVLIIGAGPIGILLSKTIQLQGSSEVTQIDINEARLKLAGASGAAQTARSFDELEKESFDVVVDATGIPKLMEKTLTYVRKGGTILLFGVPPKDGQITLAAFPIFEKGVRFLSSFTSVRNSIQAVRLLTSGRLDAAPLISHRLSLDEFSKGVELIEKGEDNVLKVLIKPRQ